jgi:hypothetical protein
VGFSRCAQLEHRHAKPAVRHLQPWRYVTYGNVRVHYKRHLNGGGTGFGQEYLPFLHDRQMPKQGRVFEWCAGPGFIGFSLLGHGLCDSLCLADVNPDAALASRRTILENKLEDRVVVYCSDNLSSAAANLVPRHYMGRM